MCTPDHIVKDSSNQCLLPTVDKIIFLADKDKETNNRSIYNNNSGNFSLNAAIYEGQTVMYAFQDMQYLDGAHTCYKKNHCNNQKK